MRTILKICLFLMLPAAWAACVKEQTPSYVGMWEYVSSDPDLGDMYKGSYLHILRNGNFSFFDAATQTLYTGTRKDITNEGLVLYYRNEKSSEVYSMELLRLKEGEMEVRSASVNGVMTLIRFRRTATA